MNVSELSIGDWLYGVGYDGTKYARRVVELNKFGEVLLDNTNLPKPYKDGDNFEDIKPIPLTEDILKKNFKAELTTSGDLCFFYSDDFCDIFITEYMGDYWEVFISEEGGSSAWSMYVKEVHKLQHALRLVGVQKEITL